VTATLYRNDARERDDLLGRVDLAAMFVDLGLPQGRNRQWPCPSPSHAQTGATPPVSISRPNAYDVWCCHGCGAGGTAVDLLAMAKGLDTAEAFTVLRQIAGVPDYTPRPSPVRVVAAPVNPERDRLDGAAAAEVMAEYLAGRGWPDEVADRWGLHAVGHHGARWVRHPYREAGAASWYQDRWVSGSDRSKWWGQPGEERRLYALDLAETLDRARGRGHLFVAEGPADVIALDLAGFDAVGIPGTQGVDKWGPYLAGLDLIVCTDPDDAGDNAAEALGAMAVQSGGRWCRLRPPVDVDDWRRQTGDDARFGDLIVAELENLGWSGEVVA
jgi:DNA primase